MLNLNMPIKRSFVQRRVMRVALFLFVSFSLSPFPLTPFPLTPFPLPVLAADAAVVSTATREGRLAVFDDVWETIHRRYYDSTFNGLDWEGQRATFPISRCGNKLG